jgi:hypothetical protein
MKQETLRSLIIAKNLFDKAHELCSVDDKYIASAGLVVLQDAFELVLLATLLEIGTDEEKSIENFTFDQLVGEVKKSGYSIPKSGTIKALNKERVVIKHYGQVAEPGTVRNYYAAARAASDGLLHAVFGTDFQGIMLHELLKNDKVQGFIFNAEIAIGDEKYFVALTEIRKAIYVEIEEEYSVYDWKDFPQGKTAGFLELMGKGGSKAPWYAKNQEWIEEHVKDPFDYVQLDHERLRIDLLEWGVSTQEFWNLWRLTPKVFFDPGTNRWRVNLDFQHFQNAATEENARYCLDRAVSILLKKQGHLDLSKRLEYGYDRSFNVRLLSDQPLYSKASKSSDKSHTLKTGNIYRADTIVPSLDDDFDFVKISHTQKEPTDFLYGYVLYDECEFIEDAEETS